MADLVEILAVIRALVVSKIERTPEQIKKDYFEMEGERIPFAQYGFQSIEDMLRKSGQFDVLTQDDGEIVITAKKSEKDQHMAKLIKETRTKNAATPKRFGSRCHSLSAIQRSKFTAVKRRMQIPAKPMTTTITRGDKPLSWKPLPPQIMKRDPKPNPSVATEKIPLKQIISSPPKVIQKQLVLPSQPITTTNPGPTNTAFVCQKDRFRWTASDSPRLINVTNIHQNSYHKIAASDHYYTPNKTSVQSRLQVRPKEIQSENSGIEQQQTALLQQMEKITIREDNYEMVSQLHELLLQYPHGVMERSVPHIFQNSTGIPLPEHWLSMISGYSRFFSIDSGPIARVVFATKNKG